MARPEKVHDIVYSFTRMLQRFWPYIRRQKMLAIGALLALCAETAFQILEPWPLKFVLDRIITTSPTGGTSGFATIDALAPMTLLALAAAAIIVTSGLRALAAYYNTIGFALVGNRVLTEVRSALYRQMQCLSLSFHTQTKNGDMIVRVIGDVGSLKDITVTAILPLLGNLLALFGMVGVMFWLHWQLTLATISIFPLFWLFAARIVPRIHQVSHKQRKRQSAMAATVSESLGAIKIVQAMSLENIFARSFSKENTKSLKEGVKGAKLAAHLERSVDVLIAIATALVVLYGARLVLSQALTPGDLVVFLSYLKSAFKPVRNFAKYMGRLGKASAAGDRVMDILEAEPDVQDLPGAVAAPPLKGAIRFEDVSFCYEPGHPVLFQISFEVRPGERIALVGPSGHGKSTLVNLIMRLYDPVRGRVLIDGYDICEFTLSSLRAQTSMVLQDTMLFGATVYDNIAYGSPDATSKEIERAARLANAHEFVKSLPQGYNTELGERGVTLSNGQRQRIAIARAAVRRAPILILDEPTTGLDEENKQEVIEALKRLSQNHTTFLIVHDLEMVSDADQILYLEKGQIRERGTHEELMHANGRYAAMLRLRSIGHEYNGHKEKANVVLS